ncbi:MAG: dienelactone hydrolase family protein [Pseudomonadota bacterium]
MSGKSMQSATLEEVRLPPLGLPGTLDIPRAAHGLVLFAHGSGSSRLSPRNMHVANALREAGFGTLLFDLLSEEEAASRSHVFDIELLAGRLSMAAEWVVTQPSAAALPLGLFGASTGAAAALVTAARAPDMFRAVVSRGGRPDLAGTALRRVTAPTLLIAGGQDFEVLSLNQAALAELRCAKALEIVPGATHLFEEQGALEQVIELARDWFLAHLRPGKGIS